jgi:hypothetical protein
MSDEPQGLTIISRCGQEPAIRLVSERVASWEWISLPRREPIFLYKSPQSKTRRRDRMR